MNAIKKERYRVLLLKFGIFLEKYSQIEIKSPFHPKMKRATHTLITESNSCKNSQLFLINKYFLSYPIKLKEHPF